MRHTKEELEEKKKTDNIFYNKLKKLGFPKRYNQYKENIEKSREENYKDYMEREFDNVRGLCI